MRCFTTPTMWTRCVVHCAVVAVADDDFSQLPHDKLELLRELLHAKSASEAKHGAGLLKDVASQVPVCPPLNDQLTPLLQFPLS